MKRRMIVILLLLLGGAVVNVAVAWGCAGRVRITEGSQMSGIRPPMFNNFDLSPELPVRSPIPNEHALRTHPVRPAYRTASVTVFRWQHRNRDRGPWPETFHMEAGWPLKTFAGTERFHPMGQFAVTGALRFDRPGSGQASRQIVFLPVIPIWSGFIINTLIYALLLWPLLFGPFKVRRALRRKRWLCVKCAYPVGTSPVCTECGSPVSGKVASAAEA